MTILDYSYKLTCTVKWSTLKNIICITDNESTLATYYINSDNWDSSKAYYVDCAI